ncbi:DivIVA domain-containing protein [Microbacterium luticocti]|uniref:DivIVA domain-containing protein n=1 Tax=Microbacterium luticocti TaxID=451764 RepID=UPI00040E94F1|nr:DivIVA domain-containing protein [Microbacterium luticocti]
MTRSSDPTASPFPRATGRDQGYDPKAVDAFLARARESFEQDAAVPEVTAAGVRAIAFPLVRRGYRTEAVDAALARVEDAFAARERERALSAVGTGEWIDRTRARAQEILDRLTREPRHRFDRVRGLGYGYRIDEVDLVADKIAAYLASGTPVTVEQVRTVAFRMQRRGYREAQVDAVLDAVVDVMLAVG